MPEKPIVPLAIAFVILLTAVWATTPSSEAPELHETKQRLNADFDDAEIGVIEFVSGSAEGGNEKKLTLAHREADPMQGTAAGWVAASESDWPCDQERINKFLAALFELKAGLPRTQNKDNHADFGIGTGTSTTVRLKRPSRTSSEFEVVWSLELGNAGQAAGTSYVRSSTDELPIVREVTLPVRADITTDRTRWLKLKVTDQRVSDISGFLLRRPRKSDETGEGPFAQFAFNRTEAGGWEARIAAGTAPVKADRYNVETILRVGAQLTAADVMLDSTRSMASLGLEKPEVELAWLVEGQGQALAIGTPTENGDRFAAWISFLPGEYVGPWSRGEDLPMASMTLPQFYERFRQRRLNEWQRPMFRPPTIYRVHADAADDLLHSWEWMTTGREKPAPTPEPSASPSETPSASPTESVTPDATPDEIPDETPESPDEAIDGGALNGWAGHFNATGLLNDIADLTAGPAPVAATVDQWLILDGESPVLRLSLHAQDAASWEAWAALRCTDAATNTWTLTWVDTRSPAAGLDLDGTYTGTMADDGTLTLGRKHRDGEGVGGATITIRRTEAGVTMDAAVKTSAIDPANPGDGFLTLLQLTLERAGDADRAWTDPPSAPPADEPYPAKKSD
jgi:hypothetical protein